MVVVVAVVAGVLVVVVVGTVLERPGSQISKTQKLGSVIGADSAPIYTNSYGKALLDKYHHLHMLAVSYLRQNSVPLDAPTRNDKNNRTDSISSYHYQMLHNTDDHRSNCTEHR